MASRVARTLYLTTGQKMSMEVVAPNVPSGGFVCGVAHSFCRKLIGRNIHICR